MTQLWQVGDERPPHRREGSGRPPRRARDGFASQPARVPSHTFASDATSASIWTTSSAGSRSASGLERLYSSGLLVSRPWTLAPHDDPELASYLRIEERELGAGGAEQPTCEGSAGNGHSYVQSLDRVIVTRKGDFLLPRPMMRVWGRGSGVSSATPCLLGRGRVRPVRAVRSMRTRCQRGFASWPKAGEE